MRTITSRDRDRDHDELLLADAYRLLTAIKTDDPIDLETWDQLRDWLRAFQIRALTLGQPVGEWP